MTNRCRHPVPAVMLFVTLLATAHDGLAAWTAIGPDGGAITALAVDPQQPSTVWATGYGGVFRSTNGGTTWTRSTPIDGDAIALGGGAVLVGRYDFEGGGSLLRSTDGGASWTGRHLDDDVIALAVDPHTPTRVYAGTNQGTVFRSTDAGASWTSSVVPLGRVEALAVHPTTPGTVYAAGESGVARSTNGGASWTWLSPGPAGLIRDLAIDPSAPSILYAGVDGSSPAAKSIDGGASWTPIGPAAFYGYGIVLRPTTPSTIYLASGDGPFVSTDGGATWTPAATGLTVVTANAIAIHPSAPATIYLGTAGAGVWRSDDGAATWTRRTSGIRSLGMTELVAHPTAPSTLWAGTRGEGVYRSTDGGANWTPGNTGLPVFPYGYDVTALAVHPLDPDLLLVADGFQGIFRSVDGGASWSPTSGPSPDYDVTVIAFDPLDAQVAYAGGLFPQGVLKSVDGGATWSTTSLGPAIFALAVDPLTPSTLYAARGAGLWKSSDAGNTWVQLPLAPSSGVVAAIAVDPVTPATVYAGRFGDGIWKSTDGGTTWSWAVNGLGGDHFITDLAVDPADPSRLWATTTDGRIFASTDGAASWKPVHAGLSPFERLFYTRALLPLGATVYVGTIGAGGFRLDVTMCAADTDCQETDFCVAPSCAPMDPAADVLGCIKGPVDCAEEGGFCRSGAYCNSWVGCRYTSVLPDGHPCPDDGSTCSEDVCLDGRCIHRPPPRTCRGSTVAGAAAVRMKRTTPQRTSVAWKWRKGAATALGDLGNPFLTTGYQLCVFDDGGPAGSPRLVLDATAPPGGLCGSKPCWKASGLSFKYVDRERPDGIGVVRLIPGTDGRASAAVSGKGPALALGTLPLTPPVVVRLERTDQPEMCFEAGYGAGIKRNDGTRFSAKSD